MKGGGPEKKGAKCTYYIKPKVRCESLYPLWWEEEG